MWTKTKDGSIIDNGGRVIYFSAERFVHDICIGDCCFICGVSPKETAFNNEHVLPRWVLRRFNLFSQKVTLPNKTTFRYDQFTVPCCVDCNDMMGELIEKPVSDAVLGGVEAINKFVEKGGLLKIIVWMGLIFLKTHLKDRELRFNLDARKGTEKISDLHPWDELHHLHCIVRCFYNDCHVEQEAVGSFLTLPVRKDASWEKFDFADFTYEQTMLLRLDEVGMLAVFNDSGAAVNLFWQRLKRIKGAVSELQLREIMAELAFLNCHLKKRPTFHSEFDMKKEIYRILAKRPLEIELEDLDGSVRGDLLHRAVEYALPNLQIVGHTKEEILDTIKSGTFTFLFDNDGKFIKKYLVTPNHSGRERQA